jgi:hypothetical protein
MTMTIAHTAQRSGATPEGLLVRHPLVSFFLLAFAFTWGYWWLIWAPLQLSDQNNELTHFSRFRSGTPS